MLRRAGRGALLAAAAVALAACTVTFDSPAGMPAPGAATATATPIAAATAPPAQATLAPAPLPAAATPLPQIVLLPTDVQFVLALENVNIRQGPATAYPVVGRLAAGQTAGVLHATDNGWWHVSCPSAEIAGDCFVSADPALTQPSAASGLPPPVDSPDNDGVTVESLNVQVLESAPPQFAAQIEGYIQDACTNVIGVEQVREATTIRLRFDTRRTGDACAQVIRPYSETVFLDVTGFPPGTAYVGADSLLVPFEIPAGSATPGVIDTEVQWVLTRAELPAFTGPASSFPQAGGVAAGAVVRVLGTTTDGAWWRIPCPGNEAASCFINAAFATPTVAPDEQAFATVPTGVQLVQAQVDVPIYEGPGSDYLPSGMVFAGMSARVLGVTPDQGWWLIACEQTTARWCFVSADPAQTVPVGLP